MKRLQTDYINLYQLHGGTIDDPIDETIEAFEILKQQGKILHYGISSIRPNVIREYVNRSNIESVMMQYSLLDRRPEEAMLSLLEEHKISVMARGALAQGILIDKPAREYLSQSPEEMAVVKEEMDRLQAAGYDKANLALQYVLNRSAVTSAVIGFGTSMQLEDTLRPPRIVDQSIIEKLGTDLPAKRYENHR